MRPTALAIPYCFASGCLPVLQGLTSEEEDQAMMSALVCLRCVSFCGVCKRDHPLLSRLIVTTVLFPGANPGPIVGDVRKSCELVMTSIRR